MLFFTNALMDPNQFKIIICLLFNIHLLYSGHGKVATLTLRQEAYLNYFNSVLNYECHFGKVINQCLWKYGGKTINPSQFNLRYKHGNGSNTLDCTLEAYNMTNNNHRPNPRQLYCEANVTITPLTINEENQIQLSCLVNRPVNCAWKRNGNLVNISDRYAYLRREFHTNDCTIVIMKVSLTDTAYWECWIKEQLNSSQHEILAIHNLAVANKTCETDTKRLKPQSIIIDSSSRVIIAVCTFELLLIILISTAFAAYVYSVKKYNKKPVKKRSTIKRRTISTATSTTPIIESFVTETAEIHSPLYELMRMNGSATHSFQLRNNFKNFRRVTLPEMSRKTKSKPSRIPSYLDLF